jgi:hypothetical protein
MNLPDLTNKRFGKLIALNKEKVKSNFIYWKCICDCGNVCVVRGQRLYSGNTKSCGCLRKTSGKEGSRVAAEKRRQPGNEVAKNNLYKTYERNAKSHNREFNLSFDDFIHLTQQNCKYCGNIPSAEIKNYKDKEHKKESSYFYNGLDRVDNNEGYYIDNVVPCCFMCNRMKLNLNKDDFLKHISKISKENNL